MDDRIVIPTSDRVSIRRVRPRLYRWLMALALIVALWTFMSQGPRLTWRMVEAPPRFINAESLIATPGAFSMLAGPDGTGGNVWTTPDGVRWLQRSLPRIGYRAVYHSTGLFVMDGRSLAVVGPDDDDPPVSVDLPGPVRIGNGSGRPGLVAGLGGLVAQTVAGDIYFAPDARDFALVVSSSQWRASADITSLPTSILSDPPPRIRSVCQPVERRSPDVVPIVATDDDLVAFVPQNDPSVAWPVCEPLLWRSTDGFEWSESSDRSPFPSGAYVSDVDWRDGRFVAVGGVGLDQPMAWSSTDGIVWESVGLPGIAENDRLLQVEQGGLGWLILTDRTHEAEPRGWFSIDGRCFHPVERGVLGSNVAINDDAVFSIGRSPDPDIWMAELEGFDVDLGWCRT